MSELSQKLGEMLQSAVDKGYFAGVNLLIMKDGKEVVYTEAGYANIEEKRPFKRDTICRIYSMSKTITAAAAMLLVERGILDLGQSVGDYIDSFKNLEIWENGKKVPTYKWMVIKDLLSMTSGLSYGGEDPAGQEVWRILEEMDAKLYTDEALTTMEIAEKIGNCGLSFKPGSKWMYGTSADILGAVIEKVSGMRFGDFLKKEIFEPLGMKDTGFYVPEDKRDRLADVYETTPEGITLCRTNHLGIKYTLDAPPAFESGGAGLVSTLDDFSKFATMLLNKGSFEGRQILKPKTVEFLTGGKLTPRQLESMWEDWESMYGYNYGNLMRVMEEPRMAQFHTWKGEYGWDGWLGTYFCNSPENKVTILLNCQKKDAGTTNVTRRIRNVLAQYID